MITVEQYWMGRDVEYAADLTDEIRQNAAILLPRVNLLLATAGIAPRVRSGWRPPAINARTFRASKTSRHLSGQAIDLDDPRHTLAHWCTLHLHELERCELWMEHPSATIGNTEGGGWVHLQSVPPRSGNRQFYP